MNDAIASACAKKKEDRPDTAGAFLIALNQADLQHRPPPAAPPSQPAAPEPKPPVAPPPRPAAVEPKPQRCETFSDIEMVWIPPGTFTMGSPSGEEGRLDNERQHQVTLTKGFWLGKYEVTQAQWESVMGSNPSHFKGRDLPVEQVSWNDCQEFIRKLNARGEGGFRLPTEAEWEYACRAGTTTPFHFGSVLDGSQAN